VGGPAGGSKSPGGAGKGRWAVIGALGGQGAGARGFDPCSKKPQIQGAGGGNWENKAHPGNGGGGSAVPPSGWGENRGGVGNPWLPTPPRLGRRGAPLFRPAARSAQDDSFQVVKPLLDGKHLGETGRFDKKNVLLGPGPAGGGFPPVWRGRKAARGGFAGRGGKNWARGAPRLAGIGAQKNRPPGGGGGGWGNGLPPHRAPAWSGRGEGPSGFAIRPPGWGPRDSKKKKTGARGALGGWGRNGKGRDPGPRVDSGGHKTVFFFFVLCGTKDGGGAGSRTQNNAGAGPGRAFDFVTVTQRPTRSGAAPKR